MILHVSRVINGIENRSRRLFTREIEKLAKLLLPETKLKEVAKVGKPREACLFCEWSDGMKTSFEYRRHASLWSYLEKK
ncbi:hypothetical protein L484_022866 [Morus notabilis]|uniref:Uncharacterized protein n=1 Tax=Morus notabilis TaxID=981085 RepID=W9RK18_9ROSA|nr:hypothetical protein L484_022866 [Morus notabilis]